MRKLTTMLLTGATVLTFGAGTALAASAAETPAPLAPRTVAAPAAPRTVAAPAAPAVPAVQIGTVTVTERSGAYLPPATTRLKPAQKCWYHHGNLTAKIRGTGQRLFVFETIVNWCGKSSKMTKITSRQVYFSYLNPILDVKKKPSGVVHKPSPKHWNYRGSAKVSACVAGVCAGNWYPWIQTEMYGNGKRTAKAGM